MQLSETRVLSCDAQTVWSGLLDVDVLRQCVPGCTEMTGTPEEGFEATVVQKVGPVKATFKGKVEISDINEPVSLKISGQGQGGVAGFASGGAVVSLAPHDDGTELAYEVDAKVGGKLAQLGSRIIDSFAKKMADQFFQNFQNIVEGNTEAAADTEEPAKKKGWFSRG